MKMNKRNFLFLLTLVFASTAFAQGWVEAPLSTNGVLVEKSASLMSRAQYRAGGSITDTIVMDSTGFMDDFSYAGPYPDTAKWINNTVFINRNLPVSPPTLGVATFDGVNALGYPYDFSASQYSSGKADTLTSKPLDLNLPGNTSVYFSFWYQAQGRGNYPDPSDTIILEFKAKTGVWHHVWSHKGLTGVNTDTLFSRVMLHITDSMYLYRGFQFRFSNWATLSGNGDQWHIDYVYLNKNRTLADTVIQDVAHVYDGSSLISQYSSMPWKQYDTTMMLKKYPEVMRNNSLVNSFGSFEYRIFNSSGVQVDTTYQAGNENYPPVTYGYMDSLRFSRPNLNYVIPEGMTGKTEYTIESALYNCEHNDFTPNDTLRHTQEFDNYYAYDDGSAEVSFGVQGFLDAEIAEKFKLRVADTLRCIDIYFNPQWTNASAYTFTLKVWSDVSGVPGGLLYTNPSLSTPVYNQGGHDKFTRYYLDSPLLISAGTTFYIGFDQHTTQLINIGGDKNTNSQNDIFYNTSGSWQHPPFTGSIMMRPVLGSAAEVVGISEQPQKKEFSIYPNPANDRLFVKYTGPDAERTSFEVIDIFGKTVMAGNAIGAGSIDVPGLSNGVYFIRMMNDRTVATDKFIISH